MSDKPPPSMPPPSEPFPGSRTPGWNDPPTVQFNPMGAGTSTGKPRLNLNKRVAFPLQGAAGAQGTAPKPTAVVPPNQNADLPPPPMMPPSASAGMAPLPAVPPSVGCSQPVAHVRPIPQANAEPNPNAAEPNPNAAEPNPNAAEPNSDDDELDVDLTADPFERLRARYERVEEERRTNPETEREAGLVGQLWDAGLLSEEVQMVIVELAAAIHTKNYGVAQQLYAYLKANHAEECSGFCSALTHLVGATEPDPNDPTQTAPTEPVLFIATIEEATDIGDDNPDT